MTVRLPDRHRRARGAARLPPIAGRRERSRQRHTSVVTRTAVKRPAPATTRTGLSRATSVAPGFGSRRGGRELPVPGTVCTARPHCPSVAAPAPNAPRGDGHTNAGTERGRQRSRRSLCPANGTTCRYGARPGLSYRSYVTLRRRTFRAHIAHHETAATTARVYATPERTVFGGVIGRLRR